MTKLKRKIMNKTTPKPALITAKVLCWNWTLIVLPLKCQDRRMGLIKIALVLRSKEHLLLSKCSNNELLMIKVWLVAAVGLIKIALVLRC